MSKEAIIWKNIFNSNHSYFGQEKTVQRTATKAGYPYYLWQGRIFETFSGEPTDKTLQDIE